METSNRLRAGAMLCFVLADAGAYARPAPLDGIRVITPASQATDADAYATGKALLAANDIGGALTQFKRALMLAPRSTEAMNGIGVCYDRLGRSDIARVYYETGLAIEPASPTLLNNLGYSLFLQGDYVAAIAPLRAAAGSADAEVAATAQHTLTLVIARPADAAAVPVEAAPLEQRIEQTTDGEQRLVLDIAQPAQDILASLGDDAAAVLFARNWTARDDAALVARVEAEDRAEAAALAAVATKPPPAAAAPLLVAEQAAVQVTAAASAPAAIDPLDVVQTVRTERFAVASARGTADAGTARRRSDAAAAMIALASEGPKRPPASPRFDSDDAELNAFAARMQARSAAGATAASDLARIAAGFRA